MKPLLKIALLVELSVILPFTLGQEAENLSLLQSAHTHAERFASFLDIRNGSLHARSVNPYTILAPTNEALNASIPEKLLTDEWTEYLHAVFDYHILTDGAFSIADFEVNDRLKTLLPGDVVTVSNIDPVTFNGNAKILKSNYTASNGILHHINNLLLPPNSDLTILEHLQASPEFSVFLDFIETLNLASILNESGPMTVLIPTNQAFDSVPKSVLAQFDGDDLTYILMNHILPGSLAFAYRLDDTASKSYASLQGSSIELFSGGVTGRAAFAGLGRDVLASNGIWHSIDSLLLPVSVETKLQAEESTLLSVLSTQDILMKFVNSITATDTESSLLGGSGPRTIFAPATQAFHDSVPEKFYMGAWKPHLEALLSYHVIPEKAVNVSEMVVGMEMTTLEGSRVKVTQTSPVPVLNSNAEILSTTVVPSTDGIRIVHVLSSILFPPTFASNIEETISSIPSTSELTRLMRQDGFLTSLGQEGPFTLLAPNNEAFAKPPVSAVLLAMSKESRLEVFKYHVIPGVYTSKGMSVGSKFTTMQGNTVVCTSVSPVKFNNADVADVDILVNNGVVHIIDTVVFPVLTNDSGNLTSLPTAVHPTILPTRSPSKNAVVDSVMLLVMQTPELSILESAFSNTSVETILSEDGPFTLFAPTNEAWTDRTGFSSLQELKVVINYHVVPGLFLPIDLKSRNSLETLGGQSLNIDEGKINGSTILSFIRAINGVIYIIDTLLEPPSVTGPVQPTLTPMKTLTGAPTAMPNRQPTDSETQSPVAAETRAPKADAPTTLQPTVVPHSECHEKVKAYAGDHCCPITNPTFETICNALFSQFPPAQLTGTQPTVKPTAKPTVESTVLQTSKPTMQPTNQPTLQPTIVPSPAPTQKATSVPTQTLSKSPITTSTRAPDTNTAVTPVPTVVSEPTSPSQPACDEQVQAYAGEVCCPIKDAAYQEFCEALFNRPKKDAGVRNV